MNARPQDTPRPYRNLGYWLLLPAVIVAGCWVPYLSQVPHFAADITRTVHLHALLRFSWIALLVAQPLLIRHGAVRSYRRLGRVSFVLFALVVLSAISVIVKNYRDELGLGWSPTAALVSQYLSAGGVVLIILLYSLAIRRILARDVASHLRYMLCGAIAMAPAGLSRLLGYGFDIGQVVSQTVSFTVIDVVLLGLMAFNRRRGLASRPYVLTLIVYALFEGGWVALGRPI